MNLRLWGLPLVMSLAAAQPPPSNEPMADSLPMFRHWTAPVLPAGVALPKGGRPLIAQVEVGTDGRPVQARLKGKVDPAMEAALETAAKGWILTPAVIDGALYTSAIEFPVSFIPAAGAKGSRTPAAWEIHPIHIETPEVLRDVDASYPDELGARKISGLVQFSCHLDDAGHPSDFAVTYATHVAFVAPAMAAVKQWKIAPAVAGPFKVPCAFSGEVDFHSEAANSTEILTANAITAPDGTPPDAVPVIDEAPEPVYPYGLLMAGESGEAVVTFTVLGSGKLDELKLKSATKPEFGAALLAAMQAWRFRGATKGGQGVDVPLMMTWSFVAPGEDNADKLDADFVAAVQSVKANQVDPANHLTAPLRPIFRRPPVYPETLSGDDRTAGSATIEVLITPDGRMRLPRIVSASKPEFGWSAATAVDQWCFDPPMRNGKPATIRIQVPFRFPAQP